MLSRLVTLKSYSNISLLIQQVLVKLNIHYANFFGRLQSNLFVSVIVFVSYDGSRCARLLSALNLSNPLQLQLFSEMSRKYFVREIRQGCGKRCSGLLLCSLHLPHMSCVMLGSTHVTIYELNITLSCSVIPRRVKLQTQDFPQHTPPPLPYPFLS